MKGVGFKTPRYLDSDHRAVVAKVWVGGQRKLREYRRVRQRFPLTLAVGPQDEDTTTFALLAAKCIEPKSKAPKGKDWVREGTWTLIPKQASLLQSGCCNQAAARRMKRKIHGALKADKQRLTEDVGAKIVAELGAGKVQEAFRHLKG